MLEKNTQGIQKCVKWKVSGIFFPLVTRPLTFTISKSGNNVPLCTFVHKFQQNISCK